MKKNLKSTIEDILNQSIAPVYLHVDDESWQHGGGPEAQSHFKVIVVSEKFSGLKLLARHRQIQSTLADVIMQIRALSLHTLTPEEWASANENNTNFRSPGCHNKA
ncbi:BolA family transcriptional regulator [bacterium]|nr:BolA family transcriptional regulator [bacterium]